MTQSQVKLIAKVFGFSAKYSPEYKEWRIAAKQFPSDSYFTNDHEDAIGTLLSAYRMYRSQGLIPSIVSQAETLPNMTTYAGFQPYDILQSLGYYQGAENDPSWADFSTIRSEDDADLARRIVDSRGLSSGFSERSFRIVGGMPQTVKYAARTVNQ